MRFDRIVVVYGVVFGVMATPACTGQLEPVGGAVGQGPDGSTAGELAFRPGIQQDFDTVGCTAAACHGGNSAPMPLVPNPVTEQQWRDNYNQVAARAGTASSSLLIDKAAGSGSHVASLSPSDPVVQRWLLWIADGAPFESGGSNGGADAGLGGADASAGGDAGAELTWINNIGPMLEARGCVSCHGTSGAYSLESYSAALGFGSDATPNVIPGDPLSLLVIYCEQGHHDMPAADTLVLIRWIVDWGAKER
jgi:hypothetical protein